MANGLTTRRLTPDQRKAIRRSKKTTRLLANEMGINASTVRYWRDSESRNLVKERPRKHNIDARKATYVRPSSTLIVGTTRREGLQSIDHAEMWDAVHELECGCLPQEKCTHVV